MLVVASHGAKILSAQAAREATNDVSAGVADPSYDDLFARGEKLRPRGVVPGCGGTIYVVAYRKARTAGPVGLK